MDHITKLMCEEYNEKVLSGAYLDHREVPASLRELGDKATEYVLRHKGILGEESMIKEFVEAGVRLESSRMELACLFETNDNRLSCEITGFDPAICNFLSSFGRWVNEVMS